MWFDLQYVKEVAKWNFSPPPKVDSAIMIITRRDKPIVSVSDYLTFWGLVESSLKNPQFPLDVALKGIFTPPQIKHLKRNLRIMDNPPVGSLAEKEWGMIFEAMVRHVPRFRCPKVRKAKLEDY
mgnify:CR=1 FL=1|jgi:23S rRNA (adenine-N6)-dimethyltransferase